jgi:hypothetical protein
MRYCRFLPINPVRFRTEINIGFCSKTAKFVSGVELNCGAESASGLEGIAGHVE